MGFVSFCFWSTTFKKKFNFLSVFTWIYLAKLMVLGWRGSSVAERLPSILQSPGFDS